jgi:hypothetical protein
VSAAGRIAAFVGLLVAIFAAAAVAGAELDPGVEEDGEHNEETETMEEHETTTTTEAGAAAALPGLAVAESGYRLIPERTTFSSEADGRYRFRIVTDTGETVQDFGLEHERRMHLIIVRRDFAEFQHLHPRQLEDGSWEAEADLREGGVYRAFADFAIAGESLTLGADLFVRGGFDPIDLPAEAHAADAGDGYEVSLDSAPPKAGGVNPVRFTVSRDGTAVDSVEPYLGANGHLVALREHDQAFLHTHPEGEPGGPGPISFAVEYPSAGRYRLFLQFKHAGEVRTAAFTQEVAGGPTEATGGESDGGH